MAHLGQEWVKMGIGRSSCREMTKPLLAILLLLPLSVTAGELDGKFLICEKTINTIKHYIFSKNKSFLLPVCVNVDSTNTK